MDTALYQHIQPLYVCYMYTLGNHLSILNIVQIFISRLIKHQKMKGISIKNSSEPSSSVLMFVNCNSLLNNEMLSLGH